MQKNYEVVSAQDEKPDDMNEDGSSQIKKIVYWKINCQDCGKSFENSEIHDQNWEG